jgi:hypothetical protein
MHVSVRKLSFFYRANPDPKGGFMNQYVLTAKGKEFQKTAKPTSHGGAVILAVSKFKKGATSKQVIEAVSAMKLDSKMQISKLVAWKLFDLQRSGHLKASEAKIAA